MPAPSHERPLLLLLPHSAAIGDAFRTILSHDEVRAYALPAVWDLSWGPVDLMTLLPRIERLDLGNVDEAIAALVRASTPAALSALSATVWAAVPESVRGFFLKRSVMGTFAALLKISRPSSSQSPPAAFVADRVHEARFEAVYRLHVLPGASSLPVAPPEEASVVVYPFDPRNAEGRAEARLPADGREVLVEVFAYDAGRDRHRAFLEMVASARGWRIVDPAAS